MKLTEWRDEAGKLHLSWLPDGADDPQMGIPHDPPDPSRLQLPPDQTEALYEALCRCKIVTWYNENQLRADLGQAVRNADGLTPTPKLVGQVVTLYSDRKIVKPLGTMIDLGGVLDRLEMSDEQRNCIKEMFGSAKIETLADVENAPGLVGHICGMDIYQLVAHIMAWS